MYKEEVRLYNVIGIRSMCITTDILNFANSGEYSALPVVVYCKNGQQPQLSYIKKSIKIFRKGMYYSELQNIVPGDTLGGQFLKIPWRAYNEMQKYIHNNVQKVLADIVTCVIKEQIESTLNEKGEPTSGLQNIFFIDSNESAKILGRLGYMYLNNDFNTFVFLTYEESELMTDVLNRKEKLEFDLHYFRDAINNRKDQSEIIPNDFRESLVQTVFFNLSPGKTEHVINPLRCDIMSQGLARQDIEEKAKMIKQILSDDRYMSPPVLSTNGVKKNAMRIPEVLHRCNELEKTVTIKSLLDEEE